VKGKKVGVMTDLFDVSMIKDGEKCDFSLKYQLGGK
jgi:hypothetical protein